MCKAPNLFRLLSPQALLQVARGAKMFSCFDGAVVGGIVGCQFGSGTGQLVAVGLGLLAGSLIGGKFAKHLPEKDQQTASNDFQQAVPTGEPVQKPLTLPSVRACSSENSFSLKRSPSPRRNLHTVSCDTFIPRAVRYDVWLMRPR